MPEPHIFVNGGLVGVLLVFVYKLPEIIRVVCDYLAKRAEAREAELRLREEIRAREFEKMGEVFRGSLEQIMARVQEEQREDRRQTAEQFERLLKAVDARVCGFADHHKVAVVTSAP